MPAAQRQVGARSFSNEGLTMETIEHKGHLITLEVANRGKGWTWTYQIGSGSVIANHGATHLSEALARLEAVAVAEREIDGPASL